MSIKIVSEEIYSPQSFLETMTGNCYITPNDSPINDVAFIERVLDEEFGKGLYSSHEFTDIEEVDGPVVLVSCMVEENGDLKRFLRWFEVDEELFEGQI